MVAIPSLSINTIRLYQYNADIHGPGKNGFLMNKLLQAIVHNTYSECILAFPKLLVETTCMNIYGEIMALQLDAVNRTQFGDRNGFIKVVDDKKLRSLAIVLSIYAHS
jgi:hypothetical protein